MTQYLEGPESTVTHESNQYRVDDLISMKGVVKDMDIKALEWVLDETTVDPKRVGKADLSYPIIVMNTKDFGYVVMDGVHRLALAKALGNKKVKTKLIKESDLPDPV